MIFKKINAVVFLLFVSLICLSTVSAENVDNFTNFQMNDENAIDELSNSNENNNIKSFNDLTKEIQNTQSNSELNLNSDYKFTGTADFEGITVSGSNIVINGNNHIIDANSKFNVKIFNVVGNNITIKNLNIVNANDAIVNSGSLNVINCFFVNNSAVYGGAIYNKAQGSLNVFDCSFMNNSASEYGGVIYNEYILNVYNSYFDGNRAHYGGAIANTNGNVSISGSSFVNSSSTEYGGAIINFGNAIIFNSSFISNDADSDGGAIANGFNLDVSSCSFISNFATSDAGAIYNIGTAVINNSLFNNNSVSEYGGAIYSNGNFNADNCSFVNNSALAVSSIYTMNLAKIVNCSFIGNSANYVGVIYNDHILNIHSSYFENNEVSTTAGVIMNKGNLSAFDCLFVNNTAHEFGGAIYNENNLTLKNSSFLNNSAVNGGAICNNGTMVIIDSYFMNNQGTQAGAIYNSIKCFLNIADCLAVNNTAVSGGFVDNEGILEIIHSTFINNSASFGGVSININQSSISNCAFINNSASKSGEVIYNSAGVSIIENNWWGTNSPNWTILVGNMDKPEKYAILNLTVNNRDFYSYDVLVNMYWNGTSEKANIPLRTIILKCGSNVFNGEIVNGSFSKTYDFNSSGNYAISATVDNETQNGTIVIPKIYDYDLILNVSDIHVGDDGIIEVTLPIRATGNITITVNNKQYIVSIKEGKSIGNIFGLKEGNYTVFAKYDGDDNYGGSNAFAKFSVSKVDPTMDVTVDDIIFGEDAIVIVTLPKDVYGSVYISVGSIYYGVFPNDGKVIQNIEGLDAGTQDIVVHFNGDSKYNKKDFTKTITVFKANPNPQIFIEDVNYGNIFVINAVLTGVNNTPLTGNVVINIAGKNYTVNVVNGIGTLTGDKLAAGSYEFTASWVGNDNYNSANCSGRFFVNKVDSSISVDVDDIIVGEDAVVNVILPTNATGYVIITVNNENYTVAIVDGKAVKKISGLGVGNYNVTVKYGGDNNYNGVTNIVGFKVSKINPEMNVSIENIVFGQELSIVINVPSDATGSVVVTVDGKKYTLKIVNGKATKSIHGLTAGSHSIVARYAGDSKYDSTDVNKTVNVAKADAILEVSIGDVGCDEVFVIESNLTGVNDTKLNGDVIINVNGKNYTVKVTGGRGTFVADKLAAGSYDFTASWAGDGNYNAANYSGSFKVNKLNSIINIVVGDIKVGEELIVTVNVPSDATGSVVVTVDGKEYILNIKEGKATQNISGLKANNYLIIAKYEGNNKYNSVQNTTNISVSKITDYDMDINVPKEIKSGENVTISISVPKDATGKVNVEIDSINYTATIKNGVASVIIMSLSVGTHNFTVTYIGDDKYDRIAKTGTVNVSNNNNVNLNVSDIIMFYHDGTKLKAVLTDYKGNPVANATIYFVINGVTYTRSTDKNGTAYMALNLKSGTYDASILFNGTDKYNKVAKNITVTIKSTIESADIIKMYQNGTQFFAKFFDKNGNLLANTNVTFNINGVFYTHTTDENGTAKLAINLRPGKYILTAINPVNGEEQGFNITVKSLIEAGDLTKYFQNASKFEATIYNKDGSLAVNKEVTFNINGVFYKRTTNDKGVVSLNINLRPGTYTITTMYDGLEMGNKVNVLPTLETKDLSMKFQDGSKFTAKTVDGQGKPLPNQNVTFNVNGVFYNRVSDANGIASLNINLIAGKYVITSIWNDFQVGNTIKIS
ncbi:Ig-like domain repeat protein [uncultured Methanobrevibacter sp.]|uniref:Ig-like domain repeat protein n=1 Tax=uncultured Methanobrevibacter sp. TaxID=253161 RepID=UPI0026301011|nr:Ig-like domain repeat protein [uncultured Methanobrevibacter sp.]